MTDLLLYQKRKFSLLYFTMLFFLFPATIFAQLSGEYTIGAAGNFLTIGEACDSLSEAGVTGPVILNIQTGTYNEQFTVGLIPGVSEVNTITFQSQSGDSGDVIIQYEALGYDDNFVMKLQNTSYLIFHHLTFQSLGAYYGKIVHIDIYGNNITFQNNRFLGTENTNNVERLAAIQAQDQGLQYLTVEHNYFNGASMGISITSGSGGYNLNPVVRHNAFDSIGYAGVKLNGASSPLIENNTFKVGSYGIHLAHVSVITIRNNIITCGYNGIYVSSCEGSPDYYSHIVNNFISTDNTGHGTVTLNNTDYLNFFFNTTILRTSLQIVANLEITSNCAMIHVKNNSLVNELDGYIMQVDNNTSVYECDYNNYYNPASVFSFWGERCFDFSDLKSVNGMDAHSVSAHPHFVEDGSYILQSAWLDGAGTPISGETLDVDGNSRDLTAPDIGCVEFSALPEVSTPLAGIKTVGNGGDYVTLNEAIDDLHLKGISDTTRLQLLGGEYTEQCNIRPIPGASALKPIFIESQSGDSADVTIQYASTSDDDNFLFDLLGASHITFQNLSFKANSSTYYGKLFNITGQADSLNFIGNNFIGLINESSSDARYNLIYSGDLYFTDMKINNNQFNYGTHAIYFNTGNLAYYPHYLILNNNFSANNGYYFLNSNALHGIYAVNNHFKSAAYGIRVEDVDSLLHIKNNIIETGRRSALQASSASLTEDNPGQIFNNIFFSNDDNGLQNDMIRLFNCENVQFFHNTLKATTMSNNRAILSVYNGNNVGVKNNIMVNQGTQNALNVNSGAVISECDYNSIYGDGDILAHWDGVACSTLMDLQTESGMDLNSININPNFISESDLHVNDANLDGAGTPIDFITTDIDSDPRHPVTPDIGADEFYLGDQNPPVVISHISDQEFPEDSGTQLIVADLNTIFDDDDWDYLAFTASCSEPAIVPNINRNAFSLIIDDNFNGTNILVMVTATDLANQSAYDTFLVTVTPIPDPPVAVDDYVTTLINTPVNIIPLQNDYDPEGEIFYLIDNTDPPNGTVISVNDSTLQYTPDEGFWGADSFQYTIEDEVDAPATAMVYIEVTTLFSVADTSFYGISNGAPVWIDYDNDKDLDLMLFGVLDNANNHINTIYRNNDGEFQEMFVFPGLHLAPDNPQGAAWGDVNNDGDLDLMISGKLTANPLSIATRLYINNNGFFTWYETGIFDSWGTSITWIDYDNDGDQDVFICGNQTSDIYDPLTKLYRNDGPGEANSWIFTDVTNGQFPNLCLGAAAWADYDKDGDQDLLLCGAENASAFMMDIYINDEGSFAPLGLETVPINHGKTCWGDYDADGDLDILFSGLSEGVFNAQCGIYRNDGSNIFTHVSLPSFSIGGDTWWVDYDNDGDLDAALCGYDSTALERFVIYNNQDMSFIPFSVSLPQLSGGMGWGDYDNDGKIDVCISGIDSAGHRKTVVMKNNILETNSPPTSPTADIYTYNYNSIGLRWHPPMDDHTPHQSLTYNVKVSETPNDVSIVSPNSHIDDGYRKIVAIGNVAGDTSYTISGLSEGKLYYISVQAIDASYSGSEFMNDLPITTLSNYFMERRHSLPDAAAKLASADIEKDGDMDLLLSGETSWEEYVSLIFQRGTYDYSEVNDDIQAVMENSIQWEDFDGDNDLDVLLTGFDHLGTDYYLTKIFYSENYSYMESPFELYGVFEGDARWSDYDNDGDLDVLIIGGQPSIPTTKLFENQDTIFTEVDIPFTGFSHGSIDWGDYDHDGDTDILLTGVTNEAPDYYASKIYRNDHSTFTEVEAELTPVKFSKGIWGDFDMDGDLDILICGMTFDGEYWIAITQIFENQDGIFIETSDMITGLQKGSIKWVDLDNDGDLDIVGNGLTGNHTNWQPTAIHYIYQAGNYHYIDTWLGEFYDGDITVGNIDQDDDIDIVQCGFGSNYQHKTRVFTNMTINENEAPSAPDNLSVTTTDTSYIFSWDHATDDNTPWPGLTYNLRLGSSSGTFDIKSCNSDTSGYHFVPVFGNVGQNTSWELINPPQTGSIFWTVQAIDNSFFGSPFAEEQEIFITGIATEDENKIPINFALNQNYPNPFNPETTIKFGLPKTGKVTLEIYNVIGQKITTLIDKPYKAGYHHFNWQAGEMASGIYFYRIKVTDQNNHDNILFTQSKKMLLLK